MAATARSARPFAFRTPWQWRRSPVSSSLSLSLSFSSSRRRRERCRGAAAGANLPHWHVRWPAVRFPNDDEVEEEQEEGDPPAHSDSSHSEHVGWVCAAIVDVVVVGADVRYWPRRPSSSPAHAQSDELPLLRSLCSGRRDACHLLPWRRWSLSLSRCLPSPDGSSISNLISCLLELRPHHFLAAADP